METLKRLLLAAIVFTLIGCAGLTPLRTGGARSVNPNLRYTLILYGMRYLTDPRSVAFLDVEGDRYTLKPFAPGFDYTELHGLNSVEAMNRAVSFLGQNPDTNGYGLRRIIGPGGQTIGYEVRPYFQILKYGFMDVLNIYYTLKKNDVVSIYVDLIPSVRDRILFDGLEPGPGGGR